MRTKFLLCCTAALLASCAGAVDPAAPPDSRDETLASEQVAAPSSAPDGAINQIAASDATTQRFGIVRWEATPAGEVAQVVGTNDAGETVATFEFSGASERGLELPHRDAMSTEEVEISEAYLADVVLRAQLDADAEDLVYKVDSQCTQCGTAPVHFSCIAVVLVCQDKQWCPDPNSLTGSSSKSCGSSYACGACFGFSW